MEYFSSVSMVTMEQCIQGLAIYVSLHWQALKKLGTKQIFFLRKLLYFVPEKYSSAYFAKTNKSLCDFHFLHEKIKTVMDFFTYFL